MIIPNMWKNKKCSKPPTSWERRSGEAFKKKHFKWRLSKEKKENMFYYDTWEI
jgi:hypothetical protein